MTRLYIVNGSKDLFNEINNALDDAFLEYDIDEGGRYLVDENDADEIINIMESLGADVEIIQKKNIQKGYRYMPDITEKEFLQSYDIAKTKEL